MAVLQEAMPNEWEGLTVEQKKAILKIHFQKLHRSLDALIAAYLEAGLSRSDPREMKHSIFDPIEKLMEWSCQQTIDPDVKE